MSEERTQSSAPIDQEKMRLQKEVLIELREARTANVQRTLSQNTPARNPSGEGELEAGTKVIINFRRHAPLRIEGVYYVWVQIVNSDGSEGDLWAIEAHMLQEKEIVTDMPEPTPMRRPEPMPAPTRKPDPEPVIIPQPEPEPTLTPRPVAPMREPEPIIIPNPEPSQIPTPPIEEPVPDLEPAVDRLTPQELSRYAQNVFLDMPQNSTNMWYLQDPRKGRILSSIDSAFQALAASDIQHPEQLVPFFLANFNQEMSFGTDGAKSVDQDFLTGREMTAARGFLIAQMRNSEGIITRAEAQELWGYLNELSGCRNEAQLYAWNQKITQFFIRQRQESPDADQQIIAELEEKLNHRVFGLFLGRIADKPFMRKPDGTLDLDKFQREISRRISTFGKAQKNVDILMQSMRTDGFLGREILRLVESNRGIYPEGVGLSDEDYMRDILVRSLLELPNAPYTPQAIQVIVFNYHYKPILERFDDDGDGVPEPENMRFVFAELNAGDFSVRNSAIQEQLNRMFNNEDMLARDGDLTAYDGVTPRYHPESSTVKALLTVVRTQLPRIQQLVQQLEYEGTVDWNNPEDIVRTFVELSKSDALEQHPLYIYLMPEGVRRRTIPNIEINNDVQGVTGRHLTDYCDEMQEKMRGRFGYRGRHMTIDEVRAQIARIQHRRQ